MSAKIIVVIGAYGSGKSEYSINLAFESNNLAQKAFLIDLDVVNPYFRSREVKEKFQELGIEVVAPEGELKYADIPAISPKIASYVKDYDKYLILDVGGDPAGCRALARYVSDIKKRGYEMHFVINTKRPFTSDKEEILQMLNMLEDSSKLQISHLICNTNLMEYTDAQIVEDGIQIIDKVAKEKNLIFENYLALENYNELIPDNLLGKKKKVLTYFLNKPWEMPFIKGI